MIQLGFCVNDDFYDYFYDCFCVYDYIEDSKNPSGRPAIKRGVPEP